MKRIWLANCSTICMKNCDSSHMTSLGTTLPNEPDMLHAEVATVTCLNLFARYQKAGGQHGLNCEGNTNLFIPFGKYSLDAKKSKSDANVVRSAV